MQLCDYGCGQKAKYRLKNGKWCCSKSFNSCPVTKKKNSIRMKNIWTNPNSIFNSTLYKDKKSEANIKVWANPNSIFNSDFYREKLSVKMKESWDDPNNIFNSTIYRKKLSKGVKESYKNVNNNLKTNKSTIEKINKNYPFFSKIEEMRYNPNKPDEKEIQVHCKNHNCENSKEKNGWFTAIYMQIYERIRALEKPYGMIENNFYCSQYCKDTCLLYGLKNDPYKNNNLPYTHQEINTYNKNVLERENCLCEYCGEPATIVHHIRPKKLEPFFALDPDFGVAVCKKCHYKYGHQGECNTGNLSKIVCSVESQKFLDQKLLIRNK